jgi:hypothetical protein
MDQLGALKLSMALRHVEDFPSFFGIYILIFSSNFPDWGARVSVVVKPLGYKPEGSGFNTR